MNVTLKRNFFSFTKPFDIVDSNGKVIFKINRELMSLTKLYWIKDKDDNIVGCIKKGILPLFNTYKLFLDGELCLVIKRYFKFLKSKVTIQGKDGNYSISGTLLSREFKILKNGKSIANFTGQYNLLKGFYNIDVEEKNIVHATFIAIAIYFISKKLILNR